jgi:hypothetical protein
VKQKAPFIGQTHVNKQYVFMKKIIITIISLIAISGCGSGQNNKSATTKKSNEFTFLLDNFKTGLYQADLMTGSDNKERRIELITKMQIAIKDNYAWYVEFVKDSPTGFPIRYDKKLGLTEDEFKECTQIIDTYKMASELTFDFSIVMKDSILSFVSNYEKELFEALKIDIVKEKIFLGGKEFKLTDTINEQSVNNRVGSKWNGYQWTFQMPDKIDFSNMAELIGKDFALYRVHFGILEPSKTLSLTIKGVEGTNGVQNVNFTLPIYLKYKK